MKDLAICNKPRLSELISFRCKSSYLQAARSARGNRETVTCMYMRIPYKRSRDILPL